MQYCNKYVISYIDCRLILKIRYIVYSCIFGQKIVYSIKFWDIQGKWNFWNDCKKGK